MAARSRHPFRMPESTLGIGTLLQQTGVYVPRRLNQVNGPVTSTSSSGDYGTMSLPLHVPGRSGGLTKEAASAAAEFPGPGAAAYEAAPPASRARLRRVATATGASARP
jgi:hypothetical protein